MLRRSCALPALLLLLASCASSPAALHGARGMTGAPAIGGSRCSRFELCDFDDHPCDPASGCTCAYMTHTCETRFNWCTNDSQCRDALDDGGARCIGNACWGTGVDCQSLQCKNGHGCAGDQDCQAGWTCSAGNGVCKPAGGENPEPGRAQLSPAASTNAPTRSMLAK